MAFVEEVPGLGLVPSWLADECRAARDRDAAAPWAALLSASEFAAALDARDKLARFRREFAFPQHSQLQLAAAGGAAGAVRASPDGAVYLCGNSLGLQPLRARRYAEAELDKWAEQGVEGHFSDSPTKWVSYDELCVEDMATMVGALPKEVAAMSSLSVNLQLLLVSFYRPTATRYKLLIEEHAFPSDFIAAESQVLLHGRSPRDALIMARPRPGEELLRTEDVLELVEQHKDSLATVLLPGVQYYTGQLLELERITRSVKLATGGAARVGFDLAHAVGNVELRLHEWGVDFACWCSYKYLNSGPGGVGGLFIHERVAAEPGVPRLAGWWGHRASDRFLMREAFEPTEGAMGWQLSNPAILTLATLRGSLELFREATMPALRAKSLALTRYLELLLQLLLPAGSYRVITPGFDRRDERGAQLSLVFPHPVKKVHQAVERRGVICDMREPDVMRIAPAPLYNSFQDVRVFVLLLKDALSEQ
jgi:kynureninase